LLKSAIEYLLLYLRSLSVASEMIETAPDAEGAEKKKREDI
jgi:hypothetical protein